MIRNTQDSIQITHIPTGLYAHEDVPHRYSWHKARCRCFDRLKGMLFARVYGPPGPIVRTYEMPDGDETTPDLETGACIDERARRFA